ncbi:hypothetical protein ES708_05152 [subsurface metagenome]
MHYEIYGQDPPLVMIMGVGGNADCWPPHFIEKLSKILK